MKDKSLIKIFVIIFAFFLFTPMTAYGLGYHNLPDRYNVELAPGQSKEFSFNVVDARPGSTLTVEVTGPGSEYYEYESKHIAQEGVNKIPIRVTLPADYDGFKTQKQWITVTLLSDDTSGTIILNEAVKAKSTITAIGKFADEDKQDIQPKTPESATEEEPVMEEEPTIIESSKNVTESTTSELIDPQESKETTDNSKTVAGLTITNDMPVEPTRVCGPGTELINGFCKVIEVDAEPTNGGSCLIATAAYGTELAPQVQHLRQIRDNTLLSTTSGVSFMSGFNTVYYTFAPAIADWQRENILFKEFVKITITPGIHILNIMNMAEPTNESVIFFGVSTIGLLVGVYVISPAFIVYKIRKKYHP